MNQSKNQTDESVENEEIVYVPRLVEREDFAEVVPIRKKKRTVPVESTPKPPVESTPKPRVDEIILHCELVQKASGNGGDKYQCIEEPKFTPYLPQKITRVGGNQIIDKLSLVIRIDSLRGSVEAPVRVKDDNEKKSAGKSVGKSQTVINHYHVQNAKVQELHLHPEQIEKVESNMLLGGMEEVD